MRNHAIYGDDDQERIEKIFNQKDEIQRMVDISNRQLMKERLKNGSKKKTVDTTINVKKVRETPQDLSQEEPRIEKKTEAKIEEEKKKIKKKKEKKEKKEKNTKLIKSLMILFIALILAALVFSFRNEIYTKVKELIPTDVSSPIMENNDDGVDAKLKTVLTVANESNENLRSHYKTLSDIVETSDSEISQSMVKQLQEQVASDKEKLISHSQDFSSYAGGEAYYSSVLSRFINLENTINQITTISNITDTRNLVNQAISYENSLIEQDKTILISFLEQNNVAYTQNENSISFDIGG